MPRATKLCLRCRRPAVLDGRCNDHQLRRSWNRTSVRNQSRPSDWSSRKARILARDGFTCVRCRGREGLEVDHIRPVSQWPAELIEMAWEDANLQTLCVSCHTEKTYREDRH